MSTITLAPLFRLLVAVAVFSSLTIVCSVSEARDDLDFEKLISIAKRYDCPIPDKTAKLVLGNTGWSQPIGPLNSDNADIFSPAFELKSEANGDIKVLIGFNKKVCRSTTKSKPIREFTLTSPDKKLDRYLINFNHLSTFETSVQLATIGKTELARQLYEKFSGSKYHDGGEPQEGLRQLVSDPPTLLAYSIFKHYQAKLLTPDADQLKISNQLEKLRKEFPKLFSKIETNYYPHRRNQFVDDLRLNLTASPPNPDSVEYLLLSWASNQGEMRHLGYYDSHNIAADKPVREIFERGVSSFKPLISLLDDRRLSVHVQQAMGNSPAYRKRIGDLAARLLVDLAGAKAPKRLNVKDRKATWKAWLAATDLSDQARFLESAAFDANTGSAYRVPIYMLAKLYPERLASLTTVMCKTGPKKPYFHFLTDAICVSSISMTEKSKLLSRIFDRVPEKNKRAAIQSLAKINPKLAAELITPKIDSFPADVDEPYWTSEKANLTHVVMLLDDIDVWRKYLAAAKNASVGLRMEMMEPMNYGYIGSKNEDLRLAFLTAFLDDQTVRDKSVDKTKYDGPCAAFTFDKITVSNFVTKKLASLLLKNIDFPDDSWNQNQWNELRKLVEAELKKKKLPNLTPQK